MFKEKTNTLDSNKKTKPTNTIKVGVGFYVRKLHFKKRKSQNGIHTK